MEGFRAIGFLVLITFFVSAAAERMEPKAQARLLVRTWRVRGPTLVSVSTGQGQSVLFFQESGTVTDTSALAKSLFADRGSEEDGAEYKYDAPGFVRVRDGFLAAPPAFRFHGIRGMLPDVFLSPDHTFRLARIAELRHAALAQLASMHGLEVGDRLNIGEGAQQVATRGSSSVVWGFDGMAGEPVKQERQLPPGSQQWDPASIMEGTRRFVHNMATPTFVLYVLASAAVGLATSLVIVLFASSLYSLCNGEDEEEEGSAAVVILPATTITSPLLTTTEVTETEQEPEMSESEESFNNPAYKPPETV